MAETLTSPIPPDKNIEADQQLNLSSERAWNGEQLDLTSEKGWSEAQPMGQDSAEYRKLEFDVKQPATGVSNFAPEAVAAGPTVDAEPEVLPMTGLEPARTLEEQAAAAIDQERPQSKTPEDYRRIKKEAKEYFDYFENSQFIEQMRNLLSRHTQETKTAMLKQFQELGIADINNERAMESLVVQKVNEAMAAARERKIKELAEATFPYEEGKKTKKADRGRESLTKLLNLSEEDFTALKEDWRVHEIDKAHAQALEDDKAYKVGEQRKLARGEVAGLNEKYGGVLAEISRLPLDREPGGQTSKALASYLERQKKITAAKDGLVDPEIVSDVSRGQAVRDLEQQLRQKYQSEGLSEEQIRSRLDESKASLDTWLKHIDDKNMPLADLQRFENQRNKEQMLNAKRQKVREYLSSTLLPRTIRGLFNKAETKAQTPEELDLEEIMAHGVDHNGSHTKAGGEALLSGGGESLWRKTVLNLELARNLARNEGRLMQGLIYMTLIQKGVEGGASAAWNAIPEKTKKEARKKFMMGMAITGRAILRASLKAAEKSREAGAVGASAAAIKLGTMRNENGR